MQGKMYIVYSAMKLWNPFCLVGLDYEHSVNKTKWEILNHENIKTFTFKKHLFITNIILSSQQQ